MLESHYWKEALFRVTRRLELWQKQRRWPERSICILERDTSIALFCIRKLMESHKLTDVCAKQTLRIVEYPWKGKRRVDLSSRYRFENLYRFDRGVVSKLPVSFFANQMIHSFVLTTLFNRDGTPYGFALSSDRERNRRLIQIELPVLISLFHSVCDDDVTYIHEARNPQTGDMERIATA